MIYGVFRRRLDVFVTSPERIAMAGQLDVICFDKTGESFSMKVSTRVVLIGHNCIESRSRSISEHFLLCL